MARVPHFATVCRLSQLVARAKEQAEKADKAAAALLCALLLGASLSRHAAAYPATAAPVAEAQQSDVRSWHCLNSSTD